MGPRKNYCLPALVLICAANLQADNFKSISATCNQFNAIKASVEASCFAENGYAYKSSLRLRGIKNVDGVLTIDSDSRTMSAFHTSCTDLKIDKNAKLMANCKKSDRTYRATSLDLEPLLRNYNGILVYP